MDTTWFAVDRHGHVALLESGEGGCVPEEFADPDGAHEILEQLVKLVPEDKRDPPAGVHIGNLPYGTAVMRGDAKLIGAHATGAYPHGPNSCLVTFDLPPPPAAPTHKPGFFAKLFGASKATPPETLDPVLLHRFVKIHELGLCGGCEPPGPSDEDLIAEPQRASERLGIFVFRCNESIAEPYERVVVPAVPFDATRHPALQQRMARFDGGFDQVDRLQPAEHWQAIASWSASWIGTDGVRHCVPGREDDYAKEYATLDDERLTADPPKRGR